MTLDLGQLSTGDRVSFTPAATLVFPSRTDTFGLVLLEALACGMPVAAYPVTGPLDVLDGRQDIGALHRDLRTACLMALGADPAACRAHAERFSWRTCTEIFVANLVPAAQSH
ncbi:glycosyltransferase [Siccirubricoccus sp. G192]|uniref:glycosyltransferase n=1 Tax=Siccirubricoccus sp. G192 TaxID=2849651 RepID=UPI001C2C0F2A|nr:glycosyltransferase [Siccirubricoccus sp. G192]